MGQDKRRKKVEDLRNYQSGDDSVLQEIFFINPCSSLGDNQCAESWDREIDGSFQSDPFSLLSCHCCLKSGDYLHSCSRSGNSLVLMHCLTHEACSLFLCFRVEFYIPIKWVAKSKLAVDRGSFLAEFCHLSWAHVQCPIPGLGTGFSVLQKWPGLSFMLIFETSGTASLCNWPWTVP